MLCAVLFYYQLIWRDLLVSRSIKFVQASIQPYFFGVVNNQRFHGNRGQKSLTNLPFHIDQESPFSSPESDQDSGQTRLYMGAEGD